MRKLYKIRNKETGEFISAGYNRRASWTKIPKQVIDNNPHTFNPKDKFEIVVFECVETYTLPL